jgi:hypothetical protein
LLLLSCALSGFGLTGWRASLYSAQALSPQLEGRDVLVTGLVAGMPKWHESGLRFLLAIETASAQGVAVRLPEKIDLSWYSGPVVGAQTGVELQVQPQALRAGERWQMMVRLKAPHGASNPHGFDYELWLWEQGVQATGYVRAGRADPVPVLLADTPWYPVERLRPNSLCSITSSPCWLNAPNSQLVGFVGSIFRKFAVAAPRAKPAAIRDSIAERSKADKISGIPSISRKRLRIFLIMFFVKSIRMCRQRSFGCDFWSDASYSSQRPLASFSSKGPDH